MVLINKSTYLFNDMFSIRNYKDGRILSNVVTNESFYIHEQVFKIIEPAINGWITFENLYDSNYSVEQFENFIRDLVNKKILITE